jgi:hypothetical protein
MTLSLAMLSLATLRGAVIAATIIIYVEGKGDVNDFQRPG